MHKGINIESEEHILVRCQSVITELQQQLQHSLCLIKEKDQMIQMLTQEKQFYAKKAKQNQETLYLKLKQKLKWNQSLVNGLKQHNKDLTEKVQMLIVSKEQLENNLRARNQTVELLQVTVQEMNQQKIKLEKEWSQAINCVKKKIKQLYSQRTAQRQLRKNSQNKNKNRKNSCCLGQRSIQPAIKKKEDKNGKVIQILRQLDEKLLDYELAEIIKSKNNHQKPQVKNSDQNKENSFRQANQFATQINLNCFTKDKMGNKVPILKLSELSLGQN